MYQNIHVALDGSECSKGAATLGLELAGGLGSRLTAVHVKEPSPVASRIDRLKAMLPDAPPAPDQPADPSTNTAQAG